MITKVTVVSSAISTVEYNEENRNLRIEFVQGAFYDYPEVPKEEFQALISAKSVGKYFNTNIKKYSVNAATKMM